MKLNAAIFFLLFLLGCKPSEKFITIESMTPGKSYSAFIGEVLSLDMKTIKVKIIESKQGGSSAPLSLDGNFNLDRNAKSKFEEQHNVIFEKHILPGTKIAFYAQKTGNNPLTISEIVGYN